MSALRRISTPTSRMTSASAAHSLKGGSTGSTIDSSGDWRCTPDSSVRAGRLDPSHPKEDAPRQRPSSKGSQKLMTRGRQKTVGPERSLRYCGRKSR